MSFVYWLPNADGDWSNPADWSGGALPGSGDAVTISTSTIHTVTHSTGNDFVSRLSVGNDIFDMTGGTLTIASLASMATGFAMFGGIFNVGTTLAVSGGFSQSGGSLYAGSVSITGTAQLLGGYLGGSASLQASGTVVLSNYAIGGSAQVVNATTMEQTGNVTLGDSTGIGVAIVNQAGATYDFANAVRLGSGAATAQLSNAGTLAALTGTGTSVIAVQVASTGTVSIGAGSTLVFDGALTSLAGSVVGAGTLGFGGGSGTIAAGTALGVAGLTVSGLSTTLALGGSLTLAAGYSQTDGSVLSLQGVTLTIAGPAQFQQGNGAPLVTGTGTLATTGTTTLLGGGTPLVIGGSVAWINSGLVAQNGTLTLGSSLTAAASLTNQASGVFDIVGANLRIANGSTPVSSFANAGVLEMTANGGASYVDVNVASTGTVSVAAGDDLVFEGPSTTLSGSITGAGQIAFAGGTSSIAAGSTVGIATIALYDNGTALTLGAGLSLAGGIATGNASTLTLGGNVSVAGSFTQGSGSSVALAGHTLTLTGADSFQYVGGTGVLLTRATTTLAGGNTIGGAVAWRNYGTALQSSSIQVGDTSTVAAALTNEAGAVFDITASNTHIYNGSTPISLFTNAGTLEMTANGGTSYVGIDLVSTGTLSVAATDTLELDGAVNQLSGKLLGGGQISLAAGITSLGAGTTLTAAALAMFHDGTQLVLGSSETFAGSYYQGWGSTLSLGSFVLTLSGTAEFQQYSGAPLVTGSGTLVTTGTTRLDNGGTPLTIGGAATWKNSGTVLDSGSLDIGTGATATAMNNVAGGVFDIVAGGIAVYTGSAPASTMSNAGTLEMTAGGTSYVNANLTSTGLLLVAGGGTLQLGGATTQLSGTIAGAGQLSLTAGTTTLGAGTAITIGALSMFENGVVLALSSNETIATGYYQGWGSTLSLGSYVLTLSGTAEFQQYSGSPLVTGSGTLLTTGTTRLDAGGTPLTIGGTATWTNSGTVQASGTLQIGNGGTAAFLVNTATGVFDILGGNYGAITNGSAPISGMTNAGLLEMTANGGGDSIGVNVASTGTISVAATDNLEFDGASNSFAGTIGGAGQFSLGQGSSTIAAGTTMSVATLAIYRSNGNVNTTVATLGTLAVAGALQISSTTTLTLGGNMSVAGAFSQRDSSTIALGGFTLTLSGAAQFQQYSGSPVVGGSGTLATAGTVTLVYGGTALTLGGTVTWSNTGTVLDSGSVQIGNTASVAALANAGVFDILAANISIYNGSTPYSSLVNTGTLEMTANGGGSTVSADLSSTGSIVVALGDNLELDGQTNSVGGSLSGAGQLSFGSGSTTLAGGSTIAVATLAVYGSANTTNLTLGGNVTVGGGFSVRDGSTVSLAGHVLTLAGAAQFQFYYGPPQVTGSGTMVTQGVVTLVGGNTALTLGGSVLWSNTGTVLDSGNVQLGNSTTAAASLSNAAGGTYDIVAANVSIFNGSVPASAISNAGLLEMTAAGSSTVAVAVANTGTILARGGTLSLSAAITGASGHLAVSGGGTLGFGGTVAATQTLQFLDASGWASITLTSPTAFAATIAGFVQGDTIDLNNVANATATFSGGTLTFKDNTSGNTVAVLTFSGTHAFTFAADGHGGTLIGDPPLGAAAAGLARQAYFTDVGAAGETVALGRGVETLVGGFSYAHPDVLDLRSVLAGTAAAQDLANIGNYLTTRQSGGNTTLLFDPSGQGGGSRVALLTDVGTTVGQMLAHHALLL